MVYRLTAVLACFVLVSGVTRAHEFWVEPVSSVAEVGDRVAFRLLVGDGFPGEGYARNPRHLERFELIGPRGASPLVGRAGSEPAGAARVEARGVHQVVYRSRPTRITLPAETFNAYLEGEGLHDVLRRRAERGERARPGRERYSRCAKALLAVGGSHGDGFDRETGLPLELIPLDDPFAPQPGGWLRIQALWHGKPIEALTLHVFSGDAQGPVQKVRTDGDGMARIRVARPGRWMVSAVHMQESREAGADWESTWSSLSFQRRAQRAAAHPAR